MLLYPYIQASTRSAQKLREITPRPAVRLNGVGKAYQPPTNSRMVVWAPLNRRDLIRATGSGGADPDWRWGHGNSALRHIFSWTRALWTETERILNPGDAGGAQVNPPGGDTRLAASSS